MTEISLSSALPPEALRDRIRRLATGRQRPRRRWGNPVMWWLHEQPDGTIRLMPRYPPDYKTQPHSFTGTIGADGLGSRVTGLVSISLLRLSASWAVADIRQMLETAAARDEPVSRG